MPLKVMPVKKELENKWPEGEEPEREGNLGLLCVAGGSSAASARARPGTSAGSARSTFGERLGRSIEEHRAKARAQRPRAATPMGHQGRSFVLSMVNCLGSGQGPKRRSSEIAGGREITLHRPRLQRLLQEL